MGLDGGGWDLRSPGGGGGDQTDGLLEEGGGVGYDSTFGFRDNWIYSRNPFSKK